MSILKGPGILLNPVTVWQPVYLPKLFDRALVAEGANLCAVRDELGAIAYVLQNLGNLEEGNQLFDILESEYTLAQQRDDIIACIKCATSPLLTFAIFRSHRCFLKHEKPLISHRNKARDIDIIAALCRYDTQKAAAGALGITQGAVSNRIAKATEDSILGIFKRPSTKISDEEIAAALAAHDTQSAAAIALGIPPGTVSSRIAKATEDSALTVFKGTFKMGAPITVSDNEIAAALTKCDTIAAAAAALGVARGTVSSRVARATEDSALYVFKGTFKRGRRKQDPATKPSAGKQ